MTAAAEGLTANYELLLVNDGSPDDCQSLALQLCSQDPRVSLIELSRNFGHHKAIMTGLSHATGELVFLIDCDLEEDPELIVRFAEELQNSAADVVYGVQRARRGRFFERTTGTIFYWILNRLSTQKVPLNLVTARLMTRDYVRCLVAHRDREPFLAGLWAITGFRQVGMEIVKHSRNRSTYSVVHRIIIFINAIASFSTAPLVGIFYLGSFISLLAGVAALVLVVRSVFFGEFLQGWASLIISIWLLGGLSIFSLGVLGIYLSKVFSEVKERPYTVVRSIHGALSRNLASSPH